MSLSETKKYRDELNFAEFPLASVSDRLPPDQKTLHFTDTIFDTGSQQPVKRTLTISASDEYGLPKALDDEVILGLIQLTNNQSEVNRKVEFTRYELIKLLGWRDDSKSYARISESLKRWLGVTLYYDKAWWSKEEQCWVSENFHILDQVTIFDKERRERRLKVKGKHAGKSSFVWNEVVFDSFQAGYLKKIDMDFYKSLNSSISKRVYRFLDKRFYKRQNLVFDLKEFALEHVGLSRNYHTGEIKRRLTPALKELEDRGFLKPLDKAERFFKEGRLWKIKLSKSSSSIDSVVIEALNPLEKEMVARGLSKTATKTLFKEYGEGRIREKLELVEFLLEAGEGIENIPAYLYKAIVDDFSLPSNFKSKAERIDEEKKRKARELQVKKAKDRKEQKRAGEEASRQALFDTFLESMSIEEREEFFSEALKNADRFLYMQYERSREEGGILFQTVKKTILEKHVERVLLGRAA